MIVQCGQCSTRFKLDDSKIKEEGVKVRCSKCQHVFVVKKESPHEENEFDSILGQLGSTSSPTAEMPKAAPSPPLPEAGSAPAREDVPAVPPTSGAAADSESTEDWGDVKFETQAAPPPPTETEGFDFEKFSFGEEHPTPPAEAAPAMGDGAGEPKEFSFDFSEPSPQPTPVPPPSAGGGESDGFSFDFSEEAPAPPPTPQPRSDAGSEGTAFDFSEAPSPAGGKEFEFDFGEEPSPGEEKGSGAAAEGLAEDRPAAEPGESAPAGEQDFSFMFEKTASPAPSTPDEKAAVAPPEEFGAPPFGPEGGGEKQRVTEREPEEFGAIDFGAVPPTGGTMPVTERPSAREEGAAPAPTKKEDFFAFSSEEESHAPSEELPPLSISSRRKGVSAGPIVFIAIACVVVLALAVGGYYVFSEGAAGLDKVGLGFMKKWVGGESREEGAVAIRSSASTFLVSKTAGEIFVIRGEAVNNSRKPRASVQVKALLYGPKGEVVTQKTVYCGNVLTDEQLVTLPLAKIEETMNNQLGESLANLSVQPGKGVPFMVVFASVPKDVKEFGVEVAGSAAAGR